MSHGLFLYLFFLLFWLFCICFLLLSRTHAQNIHTIGHSNRLVQQRRSANIVSGGIVRGTRAVIGCVRPRCCRLQCLHLLLLLRNLATELLNLGLRTLDRIHTLGCLGGHIHHTRGLALTLSTRCSTSTGRLLLEVRTRCRGHGNLPEPRLVIDDLDLITTQKLLTDLLSRLITVPLLEMDKDTLELLTLVVGLVHHVHTVDSSQTKLLEDTLHTLPGDVGEHTRDADAGCRLGQAGNGDRHGRLSGHCCVL
jgi:hypothetical protein